MAEIPELSTHMVGTYVFIPAILPYSNSTRKKLPFPHLLSLGLSQSLLKSLEIFSLISASSGWCLPASSHFCHHCYNDQQQLGIPPIDVFRRWLFQLVHTPEMDFQSIFHLTGLPPHSNEYWKWVNLFENLCVILPQLLSCMHCMIQTGEDSLLLQMNDTLSLGCQQLCIVTQHTTQHWYHNFGLPPCLYAAGALLQNRLGPVK